MMVQVTICKEKMAALEKEGPIDFEAIVRYEEQNKIFQEEIAKLEEVKQEEDKILTHI